MRQAATSCLRGCTCNDGRRRNRNCHVLLAPSPPPTRNILLRWSMRRVKISCRICVVQGSIRPVALLPHSDQLFPDHARIARIADRCFHGGPHRCRWQELYALDLGLEAFPVYGLSVHSSWGSAAPNTGMPSRCWIQTVRNAQRDHLETGEVRFWHGRHTSLGA